ncbi:MAG TPA: hypothetical protein H9881_09375 [Candidatus Stackebrandtia excrementipullorum]|nr:hypothetical protein [Candidatus Stackebrandtia excrementipullorum]
MTPIRKKTLTAIPAAGMLAFALAACGSPGSSGTTAPEDVTGEGCVPIAGEELVALEDDRNLQASENILAAFNADSASGSALEAVNAVSAQLTTDWLINLNKQVDVDRDTPAQAAQTFLDETGAAEGLSGGSGALIVGYADFSESETLANIYAGALEAAGFETETQSVGNREAYLVALQDGQFHVMPEYAASLTEFINPDAGPGSDAVASSEIDETLATAEPWLNDAGLVVSEPAAAIDSNAYAVTTAFAQEHDISTLSEFAEKCSGKASILGGPAECPDRPYCQLGLEEVYGIQFGQFKTLDIGTLSKQALVTGEVTVGTVTSTDGSLAKGVTVPPGPESETEESTEDDGE